MSELAILEEKIWLLFIEADKTAKETLSVWTNGQATGARDAYRNAAILVQSARCAAGEPP